MHRPRIWFDPPRLRWARVLATAVVLFLPVFGWMVLEHGASKPRAVAPRGAAASAAADALALSLAPSRTVAASAARAASRPEADAAVRGEREVCGVGRVKVATGDADKSRELLMDQLRERSRDARAAWLAAARAHGDEPVRAAGLVMEARVDEARSSAFFERALACKDERACEEKVQQEAVAALEPLRAPARDRLARMAADSKDPVVYALAMNACETRQWNVPPGACQLLTVEQWARLDPGNGAVWLFAADQAASGTPGQAEALRRVAQANEMKLRFVNLLPLLRRAEPAGTPELARTMMVLDASDLLTASPLYLGDVRSFCASTALRDANRRQECDALANTLVRQGDTLIHRMSGRTIGERLGWPDEALAAIRREMEAIVELRQGVYSPKSDDWFGCPSIERQARIWANAAREGELGAWREEVARSGRSVQELSDAFRARRQAGEARRASAASTTRP